MSESIDRVLGEVVDRGFSVIANAVDSSAAADYRTALQVLLGQRATQAGVGQIDDHMIHNPMAEDPVFYEFLTTEAVVAAMNYLLGETSIVYAYTSSTIPAHGQNHAVRIHVDSPRVIPGYFTNVGFILALDEFTVENGATWFLPCSSERVDRPTEGEFFEHAERVFPAVGDLVVFNARTWHAGGANCTSRDRHALTMNACRSYMRQRFDYPRVLGYERAADFDPTLRRLLGYDVRVPASMEEYYLPDDQRLYRPNQG